MDIYDLYVILAALAIIVWISTYKGRVRKRRAREFREDPDALPRAIQQQTEDNLRRRLGHYNAEEPHKSDVIGRTRKTDHQR